MNRKSQVIGVLGGMGTYATIHLFRQYAEVFPAEREWERPRIMIDNRCTMPSRVRAALYGEDREQLISEMSDSVSHLIKSGCDRILLACNTAHLFLSDLYDRVPEAKEKMDYPKNKVIAKMKVAYPKYQALGNLELGAKVNKGEMKW